MPCTPRVGASATFGLCLALVLGACGASPPSADRDGDGFASETDCNDADPAFHSYLVGFPDSDGDGVGAGASAGLCTDGTLPAGYSALGTDCAPDDGTAWRWVNLVDRDGDGATVTAAPVCAGAVLPAPYRESAIGNDCDDANAGVSSWAVLYRDLDGDGVGARPRSASCIGDAVPGGWSRLGYDADDANAGVIGAISDEELERLLR
jgi:hypothetical protein